MATHSCTSSSVLCCILLFAVANSIATALLVPLGTAAQATRPCGPQRPDAVGDLRDVVATPGANYITVSWQPPDSDFDRPFEYALECSECPGGVKIRTKDHQHAFKGLSPDTEYKVTIRAELTGCKPSSSYVVAVRTASATSVTAAWRPRKCGSVRPDKVDDVENVVPTIGNNYITIAWSPPGGDFDRVFEYVLECAGCPDGKVRTQNSLHTFNRLSAATEYTVSIRAELAGCQPSNTKVVVARTSLTRLELSLRFTEVTETSFRASWSASPDFGVQYETGSGDACGYQRVSDPTVVCSGLKSGSDVLFRVRATKDGFTSTLYIGGRTKTKLFAINANSIELSKASSNISVSWIASPTEAVFYELNCTGSSGNTSVTTLDTRANCQFLKPGQSYRITLTVKKSGGFDDAVTDLGIVTLPSSDLLPPRDLEATSINETCVEVTWSESLSTVVRPTYLLWCHGNQSQPENTGHVRRGLCCGIESGVEHMVFVAAVNRKLDEQSEVVGIAAKTRMLPPSGLHSTPLNVTCCQLTWSPSPSVGSSYLIKCPSSAPQYSKLMRHAICCGLTPGIEFTASVMSVKRGHMNSDPVKTTVKSYLDPPHHLTPSPLNGSCLQLTWSSTSTATFGLSYRIRCPSTQAEMVSAGRRGAVCCGLRPAAQFVVSVTAVKAGFPDSQETRVVAVTDMEPPQQLESSKFNATCAKVTWHGSHDTPLGATYRVRCPNAEPVETGGNRVAICCGLELGKSYIAFVATAMDGVRDSLDAWVKLFIS